MKKPVISSIGSNTYKVLWSHEYRYTVILSDTIQTDRPDFKMFPPFTKWVLQHPSGGPWDARYRLYSVKSLFCNLKWLLLSSRLQESCCPRCWSLRFKMRLPQCCERGPTQGKRGREEKNLQYLVPLTCARTSFLKLLYHSNVWVHFLFLTCCCLKVWCTSLLLK